MGAGEVVRYLGTFGSERVSRAALIAALPPLLAAGRPLPQPWMHLASTA
jgi:non-heme chloroperoxidase